MKKLIVISGCCLAALLSYSAYAETRVQESIQGSWRFSYEELPLSANDSMGLIGAHYDLFLFKKVPSLYLGLGGYGAAKGEEGGFFTTGMTAGWRQTLSKNYEVDLGAHFGGGGGSDRAFPGGGKMLRAHVSLERNFPLFKFRLGVAHTDFANSTSAYKKDTHVFAGLRVDSDSLRDVSGDARKNGLKLFDGKTHRIRVSPAILYYFPDDTPITRLGEYTNPSTSSNKNIPLLGIQIDRFFSENMYTMLEVYGAGGGNADGYASFLTGLGYTSKLASKLYWDAKFLVGLGGDGRLDTGGGIIVQPMAGLRWDVFSDVSLKAMAGRTVAVDGRLKATTAELAISWQGEKPSLSGKNARVFPSSKFKTRHWVTSVSHKTYIPKDHTRKTTGEKYKDHLHLAGLDISSPITRFVSVSGNTHWAYEGGIGSYAEGMLGIRVNPLLFSGSALNPVLQYDVGVGGGGDMDVDDGIIQQLKLGLRYQYSPKISFGLFVGRTKSLGGSFDSDMVNLQLNWHQFSLFKR